MENKDMPAFPQPPEGVSFKGLGKREYFAAMALQGVLSNATCCQGYSPNEDYARQAVAMADALLLELSKP